MVRLVVPYDTSYLMSQGVAFGLPHVLQWWSRREWLSIEHVIATEIKQEIANHLKSEDKADSARRARGRFAEIMALPRYREISLAKTAPAIVNEELLGPDSIVDRKLVQEAVSIGGEGPNTIVYIATNDGGISAEAAFFQSKQGIRLFTQASAAQLEELLQKHQWDLEEKSGHGSLIGAIFLICLNVAVVTSCLWYSFR